MSPLLARIHALSPEKRALLVRQNPLSFEQRRLWLVARLAPGDVSYNVPWALSWSGSLEVPYLAASLSAAVARHAILRTVFPEIDGEPMQLVLPAAPVPVAEIDLRALPPSHAVAAAQEVAEELGHRPFDLAAGPLLRAAAVRAVEGEAVCLLILHHILCDGPSQEILFSEVRAVYAGLETGRPVALPPLPLQYADYSRRQRDFLSGEGVVAQRAVWRRRLAGIPAVLPLPVDHPHRPLGGGRGRLASRVLSRGTTRALEELALRQGGSLFMGGLAAFAALLSRLSGTTDIPIGTPIVNRSSVAVEGLIGLFTNMLVLRADLAGRPSFRELLSRVRQVTLEAFDNQDLPFDLLVEELAPERRPGIHPLFQVTFTLVARPDMGGGLVAGDLELTTATAKFELSLAARLHAGRLELYFEHDAGRLEESTVAGWLAGYEALLEAALASPETAVADLPIAALGERRQLAAARAPVESQEPAGRGLVAAFQQQVGRRPDAVALVWGESQLSYAGLDELSDRLARHLTDEGMAPGEIVGIALPRSPELVAALLGALKAGGAYLPLDLEAPAERSAGMLADAGVRRVLSAGSVSGRLPHEPFRPSRCEEVETRPASVMFTSGSSGRPKGVVIPQGAILRLAESREAFPLPPGSRIAQVGSPAFDASTLEIWTALLNGVCLVGLEREQFLRPQELGAALERLGITFLLLTTAHLREVARQAPAAFRSLDTLTFGGEAADAAALRAIQKAGPPGRLVNLYGPTEATVFVSWQEVGELGAGATVPIGLPLAQARLLVMDGEGGPLPAGQIGELCIGGAPLATGYLRHPDLTAERFVPDPEAASPGARLYRTGDLARRQGETGPFEFQGRADGQVKIRGFRVEPGEVEAVLAAHPGVAAAAVLALGKKGGQRYLAAFWVPAEEAGEPSETDLRTFLERSLPPYMVPSRFRRLAGFPLTATGKLDRGALAALVAGAGPAPGLAFPWNSPTEEILAGIWADLLKRDRVRPGDDFFSLSGHSLLAVQAASRIERVFGVDLPLACFFEGATVAELAREIEGARQAPAREVLPPIARLPRGGPLPASFYQQWAWQFQSGPVSADFNIPFGVRLAGPLSLPVLAASLAEVARRHEALRTRLVSLGGRLCQVVEPPGLALPVIDLGGLPAARREAALLALAAEDAVQPFDLSVEPMFRVRLVRLAASDHALLFNLHHLVSDGWSVGILRGELAALYAAFAAGLPSPLPELPVQFADFAAWQRQIECGPLFAAQLSYWLGRLAGAPPPLALPGDFPYEGKLGGPVLRAYRWLMPEAVARLRAFARTRGATPAMVVLAAVKLLLATYTRETDILVGSTVAGRPRAELSPLIGLFMNTLIHRTDLAGDPGFEQALERVRGGVLADYGHQDLPYPKLMETLFPGQPSSRLLLSRVMFNMLAFLPPPAGAGMGALSVTDFSLAEAHPKYDLMITGREGGGALEIEVAGAGSRFLAETVEAIAGDLEELLLAGLDHPKAPPGRLLPRPRYRGGRGTLGARLSCPI